MIERTKRKIITHNIHKMDNKVDRMDKCKIDKIIKCKEDLEVNKEDLEVNKEDLEAKEIKCREDLEVKEIKCKVDQEYNKVAEAKWVKWAKWDRGDQEVKVEINKAVTKEVEVKEETEKKCALVVMEVHQIQIQ
jgi:hypothetical protein